jgi:hypothetical protein
MGNIGAIKFSQSTHHEQHADMLGGDVVRCNQYKNGVDGFTRISKKYLIKYGCVGNQYKKTLIQLRNELIIVNEIK